MKAINRLLLFSSLIVMAVASNAHATDDETTARLAKFKASLNQQGWNVQSVSIDREASQYSGAVVVEVRLRNERRLLYKMNGRTYEFVKEYYYTGNQKDVRNNSFIDYSGIAYNVSSTFSHRVQDEINSRVRERGFAAQGFHNDGHIWTDSTSGKSVQTDEVTVNRVTYSGVPKIAIRVYLGKYSKDAVHYEDAPRDGSTNVQAFKGTDTFAEFFGELVLPGDTKLVSAHLVQNNKSGNTELIVAVKNNTSVSVNTYHLNKEQNTSDRSLDALYGPSRNLEIVHSSKKPSFEPADYFRPFGYRFSSSAFQSCERTFHQL